MPNSQPNMLNAPFAILALLVPIGLILVSGGGLPGRRPARLAVTGLGALALVVVSYWACGFAFHLGGVGLVSSLAGLDGLIWEWASPLNMDWGVLGLRGFLLLDDAATPAALALFLAYLPPLAVSVMLPLLSVRERMPGWMAALAGLVLATFVYPVVGNWFSGGGWLMHVGETLGLGHGYIDQIGLSTAAVTGSLSALLGILLFGRRLPALLEGERPVLPPVQIPVLAVLGCLMLAAGAMGMAYANPIHTEMNLLAPRALVNVLLAAAAGAFWPCLYTWFVAGSADTLMAARGATAGIVAVAASLSFVPPWAALALGSAAGLLVPLAAFGVQYVLRIDNPTGSVSVGLIGGVLGVLAPGFFADGLAGQGWNNVGLQSYLTVAGQGVTGFFPSAGLAPDWPGQINAQLVGLAAIAGLAVAIAGATFSILKVLQLLWRAIPAPGSDDQTPT